MHVRVFPMVLALALVSCSRDSGPAATIPPVAPVALTTPQTQGAADDFGELGEGGGDESFDGFGSGSGAGFGSASSGSSSAASGQLAAWMVQASQQMTAHAKGKTRAWDRLAEMTDRFGHRLSGSQALERSIDWAIAKMKEDGLKNVRREKVMVPHWVRGQESLEVMAPFRRELTVLGLGMSVGTRGRKLAADLAVVDHVDEIGKLQDGALDGKIVLINQVMPPYDHEHHDAHYGPTVQARTRGASEAAKKGAKAVLIRSVTATSLNTPHTGALRYEEGVEKIPAAAVTPEGADFLARMAKRGPVKLGLKMGAKMLPDAPSANAIGELPGSERPDEIVVVGCHIDSWDVGTGASDDGAGCLMAMEGVRMLAELGLQPKRTIRVVLYTNEENGLAGGKAYHAAHKDEVHVGAIEADSGAGAPWGFGVASEDTEAIETLAGYAPLFEELGASNIGKGWGGADISPLTNDGVLSLSVRPDASHYFDLHHSPADTIDKIDPENLQRNAAAMGLMAYLLAQR